METKVSQNSGPHELRAPYISMDSFSEVLQRIRKRAPTVMDIEVLKGWGISEANARKILPALRFLGIVDGDGKPLPLWNDLTTRDDAAYRKKVGSMVHEAYKKLFDAYPEALEETDDRLSDLIGEIYGTSASTRPQAVLFLRGILREAGVESPPTAARPTPRSAARVHGEKSDRAPTRPAMVEKSFSAGSVLNIHVHLNVEAGTSEAELVALLQRVTSAAQKAREGNA